MQKTLDKSNYFEEDFSHVIISMNELSNRKFVKCIFRWTDFSDISVFFKCEFDSCDFMNARLNGVDIKNSNFMSCQFKGATFFATKFEDCQMTGSNFIDADCSLIQISGGDWSYTNLRKQSFQKQELCGIRFFGADLSDCHFNQCNLNDCDFSESIVHQTSFYKAGKYKPEKP